MAPRGRLSAALVASLLAGCGGGGGGPSDEDRIRTTLADFERATAARDYRALCDRILAPRLIQTVEDLGVPCETALEQALADVRDPHLAVGAVTVDGDSARAEVRSSARGQQPSEDTVRLVRVDGRWRIASLGAATGR